MIITAAIGLSRLDSVYSIYSIYSVYSVYSTYNIYGLQLSVKMERGGLGFAVALGLFLAVAFLVASLAGFVERDGVDDRE